MNYLGHASFSGLNPNILIGNMLGDFVKGKNYTKYPAEIAQGIQYHRLIDEYTDNHKSIKAATKILREDGVRYAGVFIDIFFDHFLANDTNFYASEQDLQVFTEDVLQKLSGARDIMSPQMKEFFGYMIRYNWLYHYRSKIGIEKTIVSFMKRYPRLGDSEPTLFSLFNNIELLRPHYQQFIGDISDWSQNILLEYE